MPPAGEHAMIGQVGVPADHYIRLYHIQQALQAAIWPILKQVLVDAARATVDQHHAQIFFSLYFAMTGMHALHMIIGVGIFSYLLYYAWKGKYTPEYHTPLENSGLYWHFVDIVWIYLFPLLYLIDRKK